MPDWLIWVIVALAVGAGCRRGCGLASRRSRGLGGWARGRDGLSGTERRGAGALGGGAELSPGSPAGGGVGPRSARNAGIPVRSGGRSGRRHDSPRKPLGETPLERLQRQFVEGTLTLEEYERKLDELDHLE